MIQFAKTSEERLAAYKMRYKIYVEELGRFFLATDHVEKSISDSRDELSTILISKDRHENLNGTLRVHISSWNHHLENRFGIRSSRDNFIYAVVDNFVLNKDLRNSRMALRYIISVFEYGVGEKVDLCLIEAAPELLSMYEKLGFLAYRKIDKYGHERYQLAIKPFDLEHLRRSGSLFFKIMQKRQKNLESTYSLSTNRRLRQVS